MKSKELERKIIIFFGKKRLLDMHFGLLGLHIWLRILAVYHSFFYLVYLRIRKTFYFSICYHAQPSHYPLIQIELDVLGKCIFDNGKDAAALISESVNESMAEREKNKKAALDELEEILPSDKRKLLSRIVRL